MLGKLNAALTAGSLVILLSLAGCDGNPANDSDTDLSSLQPLNAAQEKRVDDLLKIYNEPAPEMGASDSNAMLGHFYDREMAKEELARLDPLSLKMADDAHREKVERERTARVDKMLADRRERESK